MSDLEIVRGKILVRRLARSIIEIQAIAKKLSDLESDRTDLAGRLQLVITDLNAVARGWKDQDPNPIDRPEVWGPGPMMVTREGPGHD